MADILLIYPCIGDMDIIRDRPHLPLALIQAACLATRHYHVKIIDLRLGKDWREALSRELASSPLLAGLSVMSGPPVASALAVSRYIKQNSDVPIVWGGNHPTLSPEETLSDPAVDMVSIGDGEETLLEIADRLAARKTLDGVKGLWAKENGRIFRNDPRPPADLNDLPFPPYELVDTRDYTQKYSGRRTINIETSRGCRHRCRYCYHTGATGYHAFRSLNAEKALEWIFRAREKCNVDGVYLVDDNFFLDKDRGMRIARGLAAESDDFCWQIQGVDVPSMLSFSDDELAVLEASRLLRISVGADSGSPRTLRYIRKPHTIDMLVQANRQWRPYAINIAYSWIAGFPAETLADIRQTIAMMFQIMRENPHARLSPLYNLFPFPGTVLWDEITAAEGFVKPSSLEQWGEYDWSQVNVPYLDHGLKQLLNNLYLPSLCMDRKFDDYQIPAWLHFAIDLYRPLARLRMKTLFYYFPVEKLAARLVKKRLSPGQDRSLPWTI